MRSSLRHYFSSIRGDGPLAKAAQPRGLRFPRLVPTSPTKAVQISQDSSTTIAPTSFSSTTTVPAIITESSSVPAPNPATAVLAELEKAGRVARASLAAVEASGEWRDYEAHVNFELNHLRVRYAASADGGGAARMAQLNAHVRAKQAAVMDEHATAAARAFVESLSSREVTDLRSRISRIDMPGVGASVARGGMDETSDEQVAVSAEELRDALWQVSTELAKAEAIGKSSKSSSKSSSQSKQRFGNAFKPTSFR
jgi:hypothetical protein